MGVQITDLFIDIFCCVAEMLLHTEKHKIRSFHLSTPGADLIVMNYLRNCHLQGTIEYEDYGAGVKAYIVLLRQGQQRICCVKRVRRLFGLASGGWLVIGGLGMVLVQSRTMNFTLVNTFVK